MSLVFVWRRGISVIQSNRYVRRLESGSGPMFIFLHLVGGINTEDENEKRKGASGS